MTKNFKGAGLGLRRNFMNDLYQMENPPIDFLEIAPENWLKMGGKSGKTFARLNERFPMVCHGLSLNLGGFTPLNWDFIKQIKAFLKQYNIICYSEHLSYCADEGYFYDLFPIPFTDEAVKHVVQRIKEVQDFLEQRLIIENISYYVTPDKQLDEISFINQILTEADCDLLLDVNNIYVNACNHGYDALDFIKQLPKQRIKYLHIAGHYKEEKLIIDTHGETVIDPVWDLLKETYQQLGIFPTLLERDYNIPPLNDLISEVQHIQTLQKPYVNA
jgi:uncharacterized protein (UPF0276 family)